MLFSEYAELAWGDAEWGILVAGLLSCMLPSFPGCYLQLDIIFYVFVLGSVEALKSHIASEYCSESFSRQEI